MGPGLGEGAACSWGYCETQERSAPRSTKPGVISRTTPRPGAGSEFPRAYFMATSRSRVVERKANSTPPMTLCSFFSVRILGSPKPETPR